MHAFDSTFLTLLFVPNAKCSADRGRERVEFLISDIHGRGDRIVIPAPALGELLIGVGHSRSLILNELTKSPKFMIAPFDTRAALELALMTETLGKRRQQKTKTTWAKVSFDRQILAIARVCSVSRIYTEDEDMRKIAESIGITVQTISDLPLPLQVKAGKGLFDNLPEESGKENKKQDNRENEDEPT